MLQLSLSITQALLWPHIRHNNELRFALISQNKLFVQLYYFRTALLLSIAQC